MKHVVATLTALGVLGTLAAAATALAAEPQYMTIKMEIDVAKPAKDVWAKVGGYCDIDLRRRPAGAVAGARGYRHAQGRD